MLVAQSLGDVAGTVAQLTVLLAIIGAIAVLLIAAVGYLIVRASLRPFSEVEHTAAAIAAGDLTQRVPTRRSPHRGRPAVRGVEHHAERRRDGVRPPGRLGGRRPRLGRDGCERPRVPPGSRSSGCAGSWPTPVTSCERR